jgi:polyisoprenoid-binding protein YceI
MGINFFNSDNCVYVHTFASETQIKTKIKNNKTMKKTRSILMAAMLFVTAGASAQSKWGIDASHSTVKFSVSHLVVSETEGNFKKFESNIETPGADFNNAQVSFTIDVASINTDNEMRDNHLKGDDFFNAEKFPKMTFKSTSFKKGKGNTYVMEGDLTIRDVTKKMKFDVVYGGTTKDPWGNIKAGFKTTGTISRKAFNLIWNTLTEAGGAVVGDEVAITLKLEYAQAK